MKGLKRIYAGWLCGVLASICGLAGCAIENDIPYPIVDGSIQSIEVEGQCDADGNSTTQATINKTNRTIALYVDDTVDLTKLRITKLTVSNEARLLPADSTQCYNYNRFPDTGFESLNDIPLSSDTRMDFSKPVTLVLYTYQDYAWTVTAEQIVKQEIALENQVGQAVLDNNNRIAIIYVSTSQRRDKIKVTAFDLGGKHGTVIPDPTTQDTYDFSEPRTFFVSRAWEDVSYPWTVYVHPKDPSEDNGSNTAEAFPMSTGARISGTIAAGKQPVIEYKKKVETSWNTLPASAVTVSGTTYTATLSGLTPGEDYNSRTSVDGTVIKEQSFTTAAATPLTDGSFDNWHQSGKLWNPWAEGGESFWDTGNKGATTVGNSNSIPTDETCNGSGQAACLESKYIVLKFAAGNIFTGSYLKTTGTNGVLSFGRPFTAFPSKLRVHYKYTMSIIDKVGDDDYQYLKGRPDSCHIYIALTDWDEPMEIRTRPSERQLFDKNDPHVIAYAELIKGEDVPQYRQEDLVLNYRYNNRTPKYILVVASASKYGDFFVGGTGSKMWVDNFELIYD